MFVQGNEITVLDTPLISKTSQHPLSSLLPE